MQQIHLHRDRYRARHGCPTTLDEPANGEWISGNWRSMKTTAFSDLSTYVRGKKRSHFCTSALGEVGTTLDEPARGRWISGNQCSMEKTASFALSTYVRRKKCSQSCINGRNRDQGANIVKLSSKWKKEGAGVCVHTQLLHILLHHPQSLIESG